MSVALGKPVTVSSFTKPENNGDGVVDGTRQKYRASESEGQPWLMVDFEACRYISHLIWTSLVTSKKDVHWPKMKNLIIKIGILTLKSYISKLTCVYYEVSRSYPCSKKYHGCFVRGVSVQESTEKIRHKSMKMLIIFFCKLFDSGLDKFFTAKPSSL